MNCLAVDTSGSHLTVIIITEKGCFVEYVDNCNLQHSVVLMPTIENLLIKNNISLDEIDVFACNVGPGSFTGIRIGVSTIKAFCYAKNKKVFPVTSFDVLAYNKESGKNLAVIDAKHDNYYVCGYDGTNAITKPQFVDRETLSKLKEEYEEILTSSDIEIKNKNCDLKEGFLKAVKGLIETATFDKESLVPLYVRKSQAEESL